MKTVLAVFAHPDDAELTCFGTLAVLNAQAYRVLVAIVTDGLGGLGPGSGVNRVREAEAACALMGFELLRGVLPDGDLQYSSRLIMQIEQWVHDFQPAVVISHDYDPAGIDHQDHIAVARAVLNVANRRHDIELLLQVEPSRGSRSFEPNAFVEVGKFAERKFEAIACHRSQGHKDYLQRDYVDLRSDWWATVSGMATGSAPDMPVHVEAFRLAKCAIFASSALAFTKGATAAAAKPLRKVSLVA